MFTNLANYVGIHDLPMENGETLAPSGLEPEMRGARPI